MFRCGALVAILASSAFLTGCHTTPSPAPDPFVLEDHEPEREEPRERPSTPMDVQDYAWTLTAYRAAGAKEDIGEIALGQVSLDADSIGAVAVGYRLGTDPLLSFVGLDFPITYGLEGTLAIHRDTHRDERYGEGAIAFTTRYDDFSWRETVRTFFESGFGVSYAEKIPLLEIRRRDDKTNHLLAFLKLQIGVGIPETAWDLVGVLHHRSGAWGIFDGASGGSNFLGLGVQTRF